MLRIMRKSQRCKQCNSKMKEVDSIIDTISPLDKMYGGFRMFTDLHAIPRVKYRFYKCKKCNKIYRIYY